MTDGTDYQRFLAGDKEAFENIVTAYSDSLVYFAYCFVHDSAVAEDIAAETFGTLIIKRKKFEQNAEFKTWLFKIARNKAIDYLRRARRVTPLNDIENVLSESPERAFSISEQKSKVYECMQRLPKQYRDVLYLTYFDCFTIEESCRILRKSKKQVYNLLARAKSNLKEILLKENYNENL